MLDRLRDVRRHWCPFSEPLTGCDSLLAAMQVGWKLFQTVLLTRHKLPNGRHVTVYTFALLYDSDIALIRVIEVPPVHRVIAHHNLRVINSDKMPYLPAIEPALRNIEGTTSAWQAV